MKRNYQTLLWGIALIVAGIFVFLKIINVFTFNLWNMILPFILVVAGISSIMHAKKNVTGYILIAIGILIALDAILMLKFNYLYLIPIILVIIGIAFIVNMFVSGKTARPGGNALAIFTGREDRSFTEDFKGLNVTCLFGAYMADMREYNFKNDVTFNIFSMFGGAQITVPENVNIIVNPTAILGGVDNTTNNKSGNQYTVTVNAFCILGGVEINNVKKR